MARITVEDCLEQLPNRFSLVLVTANRTKQLLRGAHPMIDETENKEVVTALREIAAGRVDVDDSQVLDYDLWLPQHRRKAPEEDEAFDDELPPEA